MNPYLAEHQVQDTLEALAVLGKLDWCSYERAPDLPGLPPATKMRVDWDLLADKMPGQAGMLAGLARGLRVSYNEGNMIALATIDANAKLVAHGPKLFVPSDEAFEAMEQVSIDLPIADFRSPFPAMVVAIPLPSRKRLAAEFGVAMDRVPLSVLLYNRRSGGGNLIYTSTPIRGNRIVHLFHEAESNETLEVCLERRLRHRGDAEYEDKDGTCDWPFSKRAVRACLNLCLMLTHYGHRVHGPVDPVAYERHRAKKHLRRFAHGDFLAVHMKQEIVVRQFKGTAPQNPPGPGTGIDVKPHWRKGHWRAYPGQAALRAAGQQVPLLFVRPCLVRPDRVNGDLCESEVKYTGG